MIALDKTNNTAALKDSINYLKQIGYENIKADAEGYETPTTYHKKGSDVTITPDIIAEHDGKKHYFEISLKSEEPALLKSKWKFLETLTKMKGDYFKIITFRGHYKFTQDMLDDINLPNKSLIKLT